MQEDKRKRDALSARRRRVLKAGAALTGACAIGFPTIVRSQAEKIKIGHLTPLTGFLGALGEYAVMGIKIATDEINSTGGVLGRQLDVMSARTRSIRRSPPPRRSA